MKICTKCKTEKDKKRFDIDKRRGSLRSICRDCYLASARKLRAMRCQVPHDWDTGGMKKCSECATERPVTEFSKDRRIPGKYRHKCMACEASKLRKWREANQQRYVENYKQRAKDRPAYYNYYTAKRRARIIRATPNWDDGEFQELAIAEAYALAKIREFIYGGQWEVDHIVPLHSKYVCGLHVIKNLRVIPKTANREKRNKLLSMLTEVSHVGFF